FSRIIAERDGTTVEIHMNLMVRSAHDDGIYCVDVGIALADSIPSEKSEEKWACLQNNSLITFAEVKKLVVYPMLLAQFIGIVHEIKPEFLKSRRDVDKSHLSPILITLQYFSGNSKAIVDAYPRRGINVTIAENYDMRLARVRAGKSATPFDDAAEMVFN